jgi:hypothetical protein
VTIFASAKLSRMSTLVSMTSAKTYCTISQTAGAASTATFMASSASLSTRPRELRGRSRWAGLCARLECEEDEADADDVCTDA